MQGDILSILSGLLTVVTVIVHLVQKFEKKSVSTFSLHNLATYNNNQSKDITESYGNYNLSVVYYYESFTMSNFQYLDTDFLSHKLTLNQSKIINVVAEPNCFYLKLQYYETVKKTVNNQMVSEQKPKSIYFSLNYIAPRNNVLILGPYKNISSNLLLQQIATEIKTQLTSCTF